MVAKLERDGNVAVIVSTGYGAGWSTWNEENQEAMAFDPDLAQAILDKDLEAAHRIASKKWPDAYLGGLDDGAVVEWVPKGTWFEITEYDGSESLRVLDQNEFWEA